MSVHVRKSLGRVKRELLILLQGIRNGVLLRLMFGRSGDRAWGRQRTLKWQTRISTAQDLQHLRGFLDRSGIEYVQGKHVLYVPPQRNLEAVFGAAVLLYPADAGFKILKDLRSPARARYMARGRTYAQTLVTGLLPQQFDAGCYLAQKGLGPAVYDLAELFAADGHAMSAFVVQHISSETPSAEECWDFVRKLEECVRTKEIAFVRPYWRELGDFKPPSATRNLLKSTISGNLYYADYQEFVVHRERVVKRLVGAGPDGWPDGRNASSTRSRWKVIIDLLQRGRGSLEGKVVLGVGDNAADTVRLALSEGALWTLGWDDPRVVEQARTLLSALGCTRFTLMGTPPSGDRPLIHDVPSRLLPYLKDSVVLYRPSGTASGATSALRDVPWKWLLLETPQGQPQFEYESQVEALRQLAQVSVVGVRECRDVGSRSHTLTLVVRED